MGPNPAALAAAPLLPAGGFDMGGDDDSDDDELPELEQA